MLLECGWCTLQDLPQHARLELDEQPVDIRSSTAPEFESAGIITKLDADFGKDAVSGLLDP